MGYSFLLVVLLLGVVAEAGITEANDATILLREGNRLRRRVGGKFRQRGAPSGRPSIMRVLGVLLIKRWTILATLTALLSKDTAFTTAGGQLQNRAGSMRLRMPRVQFSSIQGTSPPSRSTSITQA